MFLVSFGRRQFHRGKQMASLLTGGCLCGAVRYECSKEPEGTMICHCIDCQRFTGTAYATVCFFPKDHVQITGELKGFDLETDAGNIMTRTFCINCGTHITETSTGTPDHIVIVAGSLDDPGKVKPEGQCWSKRMLPWVEGLSEIHKFDANPPMIAG